MSEQDDWSKGGDASIAVQQDVYEGILAWARGRDPTLSIKAAADHLLREALWPRTPPVPWQDGSVGNGKPAAQEPQP